jgi:hypothetical protein
MKVTGILKHPEELQSLNTPIPMARVERRFLIDDDLDVKWKVASDVPRPVVSKAGGATQYRFSAENVRPVELPKNTPARFKQSIIQISAYPSWSTVSDQLHPLFQEARRLRDGSPLAAEADKIAAASADPGERILRALRLSQEKVRYVALLLGDGAYVPSSADETWERRFGDCKGKTALLLALLDKLGIAAEPLLVSNEYDDQLSERLPSVFMFDHVLVRAQAGGRTYYLDATDYGQRTLKELAISDYRHGLALRPAATLEQIPYGALDQPTREVALTWDASGASAEEYPFDATLTLRGSIAAAMRAKFAAATETTKLDEELKNLVPAIDNDALELVSKDPETSDGSFVVAFKGRAEMDWSPFEGERKRRFSFSNGTIKWDADFDREKGPNKDLPVLLSGRPYWERLTETVRLPDGGRGYSADATTVSAAVAGSTIERRTELVGDRVTTVSDFKHLAREVSAEEARKAMPVLEKLNDNYAYVVGPPERRRKPR